MKMDKDMMWNIILIVSLILIINGIPDVGDSDKKTAQAAQGQAAAGVVGIGAFIMKKSVIFTSVSALWVVVPAIALMIPGLINNVLDIFKPSPTIPGWVWIGAFFVIVFMIIARKR